MNSTRPFSPNRLSRSRERRLRHRPFRPLFIALTVVLLSLVSAVVLSGYGGDSGNGVVATSQ